MKVLEANPAHVKGLYRRGMAYMTAGDFEEARADFNMVGIFIMALAYKLYQLSLSKVTCILF